MSYSPATFHFSFTAPLVTAAVHNGHRMSRGFLTDCGVSEADRLREEDPYTAGFGRFAGNRIVARYSRFEFDLNRSRDTAVYQCPEDAWGLPVRRSPLTPFMLKDALTAYDAFYRRTESLLREMETTFGRFLVLDLHSYNHRRPGPDLPPEPEADNPEINLGSGNIPEAGLPVLERFRELLAQTQIEGRHPDVRVDVKFTGGYFSRWIHRNFPESAVCIAVEFRKSFMDEWTGLLNPARYLALTENLHQAIGTLLQEHFPIT